MNNGLQSDSTEQGRRPDGCFLSVDSSGNIVGNRQLRHDLVGYQTWFSEYLGQHLVVQRLYPSGGPLKKLRFPPSIGNILKEGVISIFPRLCIMRGTKRARIYLLHATVGLYWIH